MPGNRTQITSPSLRRAGTHDVGATSVDKAEEPHVIIEHNLDSSKFMWLWAKYVTGSNDAHHCTNSIRGKYSRKFSKHNHEFASQRRLILDEQPPGTYSAIYICGVSSNGYRKKENYPHNLHAPIAPVGGAHDSLEFECWRLRIVNGLFLPVPKQEDLPRRYQRLPPEFTTCRIFRWSVCFYSGAGASGRNGFTNVREHSWIGASRHPSRKLEGET